MELDVLAERFSGPGVQAVVLMGSHARGEAGPYSDVDLVRFVAKGMKLSDDGSHLVGGRGNEQRLSRSRRALV